MVLDIGCADGAIRKSLTRANGYIGFDYPTTTSLYGTRPDVFGDAKALAFVDASFDSVLLLDVLEHLAEPEVALREAYRVLKSEGRLLVTIPFAYPLHDQPHDYQRFTLHGLVYRLRKAGFGSPTIQEINDGIQAAAGCLALSLSQGVIDVIAARNWRMILVPVVIVLVPVINVLGWLLSWFVPARNMMPTAYYVCAERRRTS
jgi:SAM-dependent methyltransferase